MDENSKKRLIIGGLVKMASTAACLVLAVFTLANFGDFSNSYRGISSNWNKDLITGFSSGAPASLQPYERFHGWKGSYPGTVEGCFCASSDTERNVISGLHRRRCSSSDLAASCTAVPATPESELGYWDSSSEQLTFRSAQNSSFLHLHSNMDGQGRCKEGSRRCGSPDSISKGLCVPSSWVDCPVTEVRVGLSNPNPSKYNMSVSFSNYNLFYSTSSDANPIADLRTAENAVCLNPSTASLTPGRHAYPLYRPDTSKCVQDNRYTKLDSIGERLLLDNNRIEYQQLSGFSTSDTFVWSRFFRRIIEWRPECLEEVPRIASLAGEVDSATNWIILALFFAVMAGNVSILVHTFEICYSCLRSVHSKVSAVCRVIRCVCNAIVFLAFFATFVMLWPLDHFFARLASRGCSDDQSNRSFSGLQTDLRNKVFLMSLCTLIIGCLLLASELASVLKERKKRHEAIEQLQTSQVDLMAL